MLDKTPGTAPSASEHRIQAPPLSLGDLKAGKLDLLGNTIQEILWCGTNYAIYRSDKGVYVHFSDHPDEACEQRQKFTVISADLCELRYLTNEMMTDSKGRPNYNGLFEHNMAQAIMLLMEDKIREATALARATLAMAVDRVSNDNTIRYVRTCLIALALCTTSGLIFLTMRRIFAGTHLSHLDIWNSFVICSMFGAAGAVFSIATRLQEFKLTPCIESRMNYWVGAVRVGIGLVASVVVLLFANAMYPHILTPSQAANESSQAIIYEPWERIATLGFLAGFAERLIPSLLLQTINRIAITDGTPVQAMRRREQPEIQTATSRFSALLQTEQLYGRSGMSTSTTESC
jgi:hypothetical protein